MKKIYYTLLVFSLAVACSRNIPDKVMENIIYEMYLTDAILAGRNEIPHTLKDSMRVYEPIAEKYGYRLADVRKTMLVYATKRDRLIVILENVRKRIDADKKHYEPLARIERLSQNFYTGPDSVQIRNVKTVKRELSRVMLPEKGIYYISARYCIHKADSMLNPRLTAWLTSDRFRDSIVGKQEISIATDSLSCDSLYLLRIECNDDNFKVLKGYWLDFDEKKDSTAVKTKKSKKKKKTATQPAPPKIFHQHLFIKRMSIMYSFEESDTTLTVQDSTAAVAPSFSKTPQEKLSPDRQTVAPYREPVAPVGETVREAPKPVKKPEKDTKAPASPVTEDKFITDKLSRPPKDSLRRQRPAMRDSLLRQRQRPAPVDRKQHSIKEP